MNEIRREAVNYFKSEKAYHSLFKKFREKYQSIGRIGGTVPVRFFSKEELAVFAKFFGVSVSELEKKGSLSLQKFEEQLEKTRFQGIGLKTLLDDFFGEVIYSKKEMERRKEEERIEKFSVLKKSYPVLAEWLDYVSEKHGDSRWILRLAEEDFGRFKAYADQLAKAVRSLPEKPERLPFFSQRITSNPHSFDVHTELGKMFLHLLAFLLDGTASRFPRTTEEVNDLLNEYGIYRDDLLNFATMSGFFAEGEDGALHPVWKASAESQTVVHYPLRALVRLKRIYPRMGKKVWIVENSGVFSTLLDEAPEAPIICTNGQFKLATWFVLEKLAREGCTFYYSGDFDPEGLGMAERLMDRFPGRVRLWRLSLEDYRKSRPAEEISPTRLEKLKGIDHADLKPVAEEMEKSKRAGYQESLIEWLVKDLKNENG